MSKLEFQNYIYNPNVKDFLMVYSIIWNLYFLLYYGNYKHSKNLRQGPSRNLHLKMNDNL